MAQCADTQSLFILDPRCTKKTRCFANSEKQKCHFNEMKSLKTCSVSCRYCHRDKPNVTKFSFQMSWNTWAGICFRNSFLTSHSPLIRCFQASSPASPQASRAKAWLSPTRGGKKGSCSEEAAVSRAGFHFRHSV